MIQNLTTLKQSAKACSIPESSGGQVQKIYSTAHLICFVVRSVGKTNYIYLGRGYGTEGIWPGEKVPPPELRVIDHFLEYLRKHIKGKKITHIGTCADDRIVAFYIVSKLGKEACSFFWQGRKLYFAHCLVVKEGVKVFTSWGLSSDELNNCEQINELFKSVGKTSLVNANTAKLQNFDEFVDQYISKQMGKLSSTKVQKKRSKFLARKRDKIEKDLDKILKRDELENFVKEYDHLKDIPVELLICGLKLKFKRVWNNYQKIDYIYKKIKSFKVAESILKGRLADVDYEISKLEHAKHVLQKSDAKIIPVVWNSRVKKQVQDKGDMNYQLYKISESTVAVGYDARSNDYLRSKWASKDDYWFHVEGEKGGHIIVKTSGEDIFNESFLSIVASIVSEASNLSILEIPLVYSLVKHLKGVKGTPGKVICKRPKYIKVKFNIEWKNLVGPIN